MKSVARRIEFQLRADECRELAEQAFSDIERESFLIIADSYERLAEAEPDEPPPIER